MTTGFDQGGRPVRSRRLSVARLALVAGAMACGAALLVLRHQSAASSASPAATTWFAPYVDATIRPEAAFGDTRFNPADSVVLGFVVADPQDACAPSWGGYYSPDEAGTGVDLDRRLASLRRRGGTVAVSFGGAVNTDLAVACTDTAALADAYQAVVDRYDAEVIDLDIEGAALTDASARDRRAAAIALLQTRLAGGPAVWLTLPVSEQGLDEAGTATLAAFLAAGVRVAGVNAMTMNFGSTTAATSMSAAVAAALTATAAQVAEAFATAGEPLSSAGAWAHLGATVMIGRNDVRTEVFTLDDAAALVTLAAEHGLGRLSMWSLNRDAACGPEVDAGVAQNLCSGVEQVPGAFATLLASGEGSTATAAAPTVDPAASRSAPRADDPATSPYPIWAPGRGYAGDAKVVWRGNVYQAKWWNQDVQPDTPAANPWDTPWTLVGPVLATDVAATTTIPAGLLPEWNPASQYQAGSRVQHGGVAYQAKWFALGFEPGAAATDPWDTPWVAIDLETLTSSTFAPSAPSTTSTPNTPNPTSPTTAVGGANPS